MSDTITIALNRLIPWKGNVRRIGASDGIAELAASIASHGLLQSLVVREAKRGKYEIIAGQRRYLALKSLAKDGAIAKDHPVACMLANDTVEASELSLAENVVRAPMHPADQFEAFRTVIDAGASVADVAARFGVAEQLVAKRLKLGRLSPVILEAYRQDEIGLEEAQAFAISDDHAEQERVFTELTDWNRTPHAIRQALTADEIPATDRRVRFVGLDAYEQAGGAIRRDLFNEDGSGFVQDAALLDTLVANGLQAVADTVRGEGWSWIEIAPEIGYDGLAQFSRLYPERGELSAADQSELDSLSAEYDELAESGDENDSERLAAVEQRIDELTASAESWPAETLATAGAIVTLDRDGTVRVERGLVRKDDARKAKAAARAAANDDAPVADAALPATLVEDLTAHKTAAIGAELLAQRDVALAATVHALALGIFYPGYSDESCLELRVSPPYLSKHFAEDDTRSGHAVLTQERDRWGERLPGNPRDLWDWCLDRTRDELLDLMAFITANAVNAVQRKGDRPDHGRLAHAQALRQALRLDMSAWFTPTAESYFGRVSKGHILAAIDEAKGAHGPALEKLKKAELAARAETLISGTCWLPAPLRVVADEPSVPDEALPEAAQ